MNGKKNELNNGYNDNGKADILTFVQTGHFNFRLTQSRLLLTKPGPGRILVSNRLKGFPS